MRLLLRRGLAALSAATTLLAASACNGDSTPSPTATPATTTPSATPTSTATPPSTTPTVTPTATNPTVIAAIVTFRVAGSEEYRVRLTDPADIAIATKLLAGEEAPRIPNGRVVRGDPDVNTGYTWHIDPADFEFADLTTEVCDGLPSDVEKGAITSDRYCPWAAEVVAVEAEMAVE